MFTDPCTLLIYFTLQFIYVSMSYFDSISICNFLCNTIKQIGYKLSRWRIMWDELSLGMYFNWLWIVWDELGRNELSCRHYYIHLNVMQSSYVDGTARWIELKQCYIHEFYLSYKVSDVWIQSWRLWFTHSPDILLLRKKLFPKWINKPWNENLLSFKSKPECSSIDPLGIGRIQISSHVFTCFSMYLVSISTALSKQLEVQLFAIRGQSL